MLFIVVGRQILEHIAQWQPSVHYMEISTSSGVAKLRMMLQYVIYSK